MPSTLVSRRRLLAASGGCLSAAFAGCLEFSGSESVSGHAADSGTVESTHDYESLAVRAADETLVAYPSEDDAEANDEEARALHAGFFVVDEADAAALWIDPAVDEAAAARAFVEETDFERQSIVVEQRPIDDCYRRRLLGVRAADDSVRTDFCRELKAPTTPCEADETVVEATFVRVHRPYDERPSSRSSSEANGCPASDGHGNESAANDSNETGSADGEDRR